jgi:hypothetical protein
MASKPKLRWFQFSLQTFLLSVTLVSVLCATGSYIGWWYIGYILRSVFLPIATYIGWVVRMTMLGVVAVGSVIAITRSVEFVRLLGAAVVGLLACWFVIFYGAMARIRFGFDHSGATPHDNDMSHFVTAWQQYAFAIPILGLLLGCVIIWRWSKQKVLVEEIVQTLWILALIWVGLAIIVWQIMNIPSFYGMRLQY